MHPDQLVARPSFNRQWLLPASIINHASLGAIFAWGSLSQPLLRLNGVLVPAASDWTLGDISFTFSLVVGGFAWAAVFGKYHDRWGPRACGVLGGLQVGAGFGLGSLAIASHNLPLLYGGGLIWGLSMGWAYVPALANVIKWYPESKGFASSAVVVGYGGGPLIATPLYYGLIQHFQKAPEYVGAAGEVVLANHDGRLYTFAEALGQDVEVVVATAADIQKSAFLSEACEAGVYIVGSGSTGASEAFACMGSVYASAIVLAAYVHRLVPETPTPEKEQHPIATTAITGASEACVAAKDGGGRDEAREDPPAADLSEAQLRNFTVPPEVAVRSPQFWLMYGGFGLSITGAYGMLSSSALMLTECYGGPNGLPEVVTPLFAAQFVSMTAVFNLGGRLFWANASGLSSRARAWVRTELLSAMATPHSD
jgi:hypothetical protein